MTLSKDDQMARLSLFFVHTWSGEEQQDPATCDPASMVDWPGGGLAAARCRPHPGRMAFAGAPTETCYRPRWPRAPQLICRRLPREVRGPELPESVRLSSETPVVPVPGLMVFDSAGSGAREPMTVSRSLCLWVLSTMQHGANAHMGGHVHQLLYCPHAKPLYGPRAHREDRHATMRDAGFHWLLASDDALLRSLLAI